MNRLIGVVYVFTNAGLRGGRKIGRTVKGADKRAVQVTREYGTVHPFRVESKHVVGDPNLVEALAHHILRRKRVKNTEIFMVTAPEAKAAIKKAAAMAVNGSRWQRLWLSLTLPKPVQGNGHSKLRQPWGLLFAFAVIAVLVWLATSKPKLPEWLPDQVYRAGVLFEKI
jgi:hypothetical protein